MDEYPGDWVGYVRVSTEDQAEHGVSLDAQRKRIEAFTLKHGIKLVEVIQDAGKSAKTLERPGMRRVIDCLNRGFAGVVIAKLDRLTRDLHDWTSLVKEHFSRPDGPRLISASEPIETRTAMGRLFGNVMIAFSQGELEIGVERSATAMAHKRGKGERLGTIPYGYRLGPDGKALEVCFEERSNLAFMRALRAKDYTIRGIAQALDMHSIPSRSGHSWSPSTVAKLLKEDEEVPCSDGN